MLHIWRLGLPAVIKRQKCTYQVSLEVSGSSSRSDDQGFESHADHWRCMRSRVRQRAPMGTKASCDVGTHRPVVALDCLYPHPALKYATGSNIAAEGGLLLRSPSAVIFEPVAFLRTGCACTQCSGGNMWCQTV